MEKLLQYLDEVDDFVWSMPLLWEQARRLLARLIALLAGALVGVAVTFAAFTTPLVIGGLLLAAIVALLARAPRQSSASWTARHS